MKLIEQLRWWAAECERTNFGCQARKLLLEAAEALEKADPQWIPVERLPEDYRNKYGELIPFLACEEWTEYPYRAFYDGKNWGDGYLVVPVKWWMPLPKLPEDGERVSLEEVVDIDAQTQRNNAAMRRLIDFVMDGGNQ